MVGVAMPDDRAMTPRERVELVIDAQGVEEAVRFVFAAPDEDRPGLLAGLCEACGTSLPADEAAWAAWLDELRELGVVGFGDIDTKTLFASLPADPELMTSLISESTGLRLQEELTAGGSAFSEGTTNIIETPATPPTAPVAASLPAAGPGCRLGNYEILDKVGEGGMGAVYRARQVTMDRTVALKVLGPWLARNESYIARFLREARLAAKLDHPNVVRGIDAGEQDGTYYLAMEFVEGESLGSVLRRVRTLPEDRAVDIAMQVARALAHAAEIGLIHRDVKPENILLAADGSAKLADLGLAKLIGADASHATQTGVSLGTPYYMSPEQVRADKSIDIRADIYSLGGTLYRIVTGVPPFRGSTAFVTANKHITERLVPAQKRNPEVSEGLSRVIDRMMSKKPSERYATPGELLADLESLSAGRDPQHAPPSRRLEAAPAAEADAAEAERVIESRLRARRVWASVVSTLVLLALLLIWLLGDGSSPVEKAEPGSANDGVEAPAERTASVSDVVSLRLEAETRMRAALALPREPSTMADVQAMHDEWVAGERARGSENLQAALRHYGACRSRADGMLALAEDIASCVDERRAAERAREASAPLQAFAVEEWRMADAAYALAKERRRKGELLQAAADYNAATKAFERHRKLAAPLARDKAIATARDHEEGGRLDEALAAFKHARGLGADVDADIARLEETTGRARDIETVLDLIRKGEAVRAAHAAFVLSQARPKDPDVRGLVQAANAAVAAKPAAEAELPRGARIELVVVAPGRFVMGSDDGDLDERPAHAVTIPRAFMIGRTEVTRSQYAAVMGGDGGGEDAALPAAGVSWKDATEFCRKLSEATGRRYRLPTEAEWEFAARAGSTTAYCFGDEATNLDEYAWHAHNADRAAHPVSQKKPNAWRMADMHGNVWEWCADRYASGYYSVSPTENPGGPDAGDERVLRGGSWMSRAKSCRVTERIRYAVDVRYSDVGFRVVCEVE